MLVYLGLASIPAVDAAEAVVIYYRQSVLPRQVFGMLKEGRGREAWPEAHQFMEKHPVKRFVDWAEAVNISFSEILYKYPRAWGHVAVEIPMPEFIPFEGELSLPQVYSFQAVRPDELPRGHPLKHADRDAYMAWLWGEGPLPGKFFRDEGFVTDPHNPMTLRRVEVEVNDFQLRQIQENIERLSSRSTISYQLPRSGRFSPGCQNCVTAIGEVFVGTGISLHFIPKNGSLLLMDDNFRKAGGNRRGHKIV